MFCHWNLRSAFLLTVGSLLLLFCDIFNNDSLSYLGWPIQLVDCQSCRSGAGSSIGSDKLYGDLHLWSTELQLEQASGSSGIRTHNGTEKMIFCTTTAIAGCLPVAGDSCHTNTYKQYSNSCSFVPLYL